MTENTVNHTTFTIETRRDHKRGCGWRQPGGLYLISGELAAPCGRLPCPLTACPTCGGGFHMTRGWTWTLPGQLFGHGPCPSNCKDTINCPLKHLNDLPRSGLMWVGSTHYKTPRNFTEEASRLGISKRIPHVPIGFAIGDTRVFLAHPEASWDAELYELIPGIFATFVPTAVEYVVKPDDLPGKLENLQTKGATLVHIERVEPEPLLLP